MPDCEGVPEELGVSVALWLRVWLCVSEGVWVDEGVPLWVCEAL